MNNLKNFLDLSRTSIIVAVIIFIIIVIISKYTLGIHINTHSEPDSEPEGIDWIIIIYSILIGLICSFGYLAMFKYITRDDCDILTDPFCSKLNIV